MLCVSDVNVFGRSTYVWYTWDAYVLYGFSVVCMVCVCVMCVVLCVLYVLRVQYICGLSLGNVDRFMVCLCTYLCVACGVCVCGSI